MGYLAEADNECLGMNAAVRASAIAPTIASRDMTAACWPQSFSLAAAKPCLARAAGCLLP